MGQGRIKLLVTMLAALLIAAPAMAQSEPAQPRTWLDDGDVPADLVAQSKTGITTVQFDVTEKGRAENCTVIESSGSVKLDRQSCALMLRAPRFTVAKDEQGQAVRSVQTRKVNWAKMAK